MKESGFDEVYNIQRGFIGWISKLPFNLVIKLVCYRILKIS